MSRRVPTIVHRLHVNPPLIGLRVWSRAGAHARTYVRTRVLLYVWFYQQRAQRCKGLSLPSIQLKHGAVMTQTSSLHRPWRTCSRTSFFGITFTSSVISCNITKN